MSGEELDRALIPTEREAMAGLGARFPVPPFRLLRRDDESAAAGSSGTRVDGVIELEWEGVRQRFAVEYKSSATPKQVELAVQQLRRYTDNVAELRPLLAAPYLSREIIDRLLEEKVSGIDLCGNMAIIVPGRWLVMRTGAPNSYPASASIKNIFRGKSSVVARALMLKGSFPSATAIVAALAETGGVTPSTVSKVLKSLDEERIVLRGDDIRVVQPERLLEKLAGNFTPPRTQRRVVGKLGLSPDVRARLDENAKAGGVLYAAREPGQYMVLPTSDPALRIYTTDVDRILGALPFDPLSRFPDVELVETTDPTTFYGRVRRDAFFWTSPLQVYLEFATGEKRERQGAEQMRSDLLAFRYR